MIMALLLLISSAEADWFRVQSSTPVRNRTNLFVATYMNRGPIEAQIHQSVIPFYLTVAFDLTLSNPIVFYKTSPCQECSNAAHLEAEEHVTTRSHFQHGQVPPRSPRRSSTSSRNPVAPYERYQGVFLGDPNLGYDEQFGIRDE